MTALHSSQANAKVVFHAIGHDRVTSQRNLRTVLSCKIIVAATAASNFVRTFFLSYQNLLTCAAAVSVASCPLPV